MTVTTKDFTDIFFLQYKPQIWNTSYLDLYYKIEIVFFHIINKLILLY